MLARANGDPTRERIHLIENKLRTVFGFQRELTERMTQARFIAQQTESFEKAAGVFAVSCVEPVMTTLVAEAPPTVTVVVPGAKLEPVTVIVVPPAVGPSVGVTALTVGAARYV